MRVGLKSARSNEGNALMVVNALCGVTGEDLSPSHDPLVVGCAVPLLGRFVQVQRTSSGFLELAEIEVLVTDREYGKLRFILAT